MGRVQLGLGWGVWAYWAQVGCFGMGEAYNRLIAMVSTTLYQIHDSTLKATMASCPRICCRRLSQWDVSASGRCCSLSRVLLGRVVCVFSGAPGTLRHISDQAGSLVRVASAITQKVE